MEKICFCLLGYKGFYVLQEILKSVFAECIECVVCARDKGQKDYYGEIYQLCVKNQIIFYDRGQIELEDKKYIFAIGWRWIIKSNGKILVLHDSILPKYRGFNPLVSALVNGDKNIGASLLFGENEYDSGDILMQKSIEIDYPITIWDAIQKIARLYVEIVIDYLKKHHNQQLMNGIPQNSDDASYSLWRDSWDYFINWEWDCYKIERFINAVGYPYDGAKSYLNGRIVRILEARSYADVKIVNRDCGKIIFIKNGNPVVVCKKGLLEILKIVDNNNKVILIDKIRLRFEASKNRGLQ